MPNIEPYLEKPPLPKLSEPCKAKMHELLQTLIAMLEIRMEEMRDSEVPPQWKNWKRNQLKWWKHQRSAYVWLDKIIGQQKEESVGDAEFCE